MCVIIVKQKEKMMSREIAKTSARINPHGLGIIWLDTFEVSYHDSKDYNILLTERPFIAHFRYATVGAINRENTHPFVCGNNKDEYLMMNGTIKGLGNTKMCDSKVLANQLGLRPRQSWKSELEQFDCRFVTVNTRTRSFQMYNRDDWHYKDGIWYSKANVLETNLIAVYGTLKLNYSNYHRYLRSSKFLGSGNTVDKYPLLIEGLPYMVDKKGVGHNVDVHIFKVSDDTLRNIDMLEGHPKWYKRRKVDIRMSGGNRKVLSCWLYFNPKHIDKHTEMHEAYTQNTSQRFFSMPTRKPIKNIQSSLWDIKFDGDSKKDCTFCFQELQFDDTIDQYHCNNCNDWYTRYELESL